MPLSPNVLLQAGAQAKTPSGPANISATPAVQGDKPASFARMFADQKPAKAAPKHKEHNAKGSDKNPFGARAAKAELLGWEAQTSQARWALQAEMSAWQTLTGLSALPLAEPVAMTGAVQATERPSLASQTRYQSSAESRKLSAAMASCSASSRWLPVIGTGRLGCRRIHA